MVLTLARRKKSPHAYIDVRMVQLQEERDKLPDNERGNLDKQWFNRIISELHWVKQGQGNCFMEEEINEVLNEING